MSEPVITIDIILNSLTVVAGLALLIERTIEIFKHNIQLSGNVSERDEEFKLRGEQIHRAGERLNELETILDKMDANDGILPDVIEPVDTLDVSKKTLVEIDPVIDDSYEATPFVALETTSVKNLQKTQKILFYQLASLGLGIMAADIFNIKLLSLFLVPTGIEDMTALLPATNSINVFAIFDTIISGIIIGGGSQPVHALIRFINERKVDTSGDVNQESFFPPLQEPADTPVNPITNKPWQTIIYNGGVNPLSLEDRNKRAGNPIKIVYHHTAMADHKTFQDVVDEFLIKRKWSTGYHSVIMPDGTAEAFCRWDRVGNHAKNFNNRSLGVAFHGNFHTLEDDDFTNVHGVFGAKSPTEAQLNAGARQIALWAHLYDLDIEHQVIPHKDVLPGHTVCPGSNFPHTVLKNKIMHYYKLLQTNELANNNLSDLKEMPYIYV